MSLPPGFSLEVEESDEALRKQKQSLLDRLNLLPFTSSDSVVNYLRIMYSTAQDLYFIEPFITSHGRYPEYDQPDNYRKSLFRGRELLASLTPDQAFVTAEVSDLISAIDAEVDAYCGRLATFTAQTPRMPEKNDTDMAISRCHKAQSVLGCGGLFASEDLAKDATIVRIEEASIINVFAALRDDLFGQVAKYILDIGHHVDTVLLLFLVELRRRDPGGVPALWGKFFGNAPRDFETLMTWPEEAVEALGVAAVAAEVQVHKDTLIQTYSTLPGNICEKFPLEELLWAKCLCSSRSFMNGNVPARNEYEGEVLEKIPSRRLTCVVPGLDLLNHSPYAQCRVPVFRDDALEIKIEAAVKENQEIFLNYGGITNWEFLFHQGFFFSGNVNDKIEIELEPETEEHLALFRRLDLPTTHVLRLGAPGISPKFFQAVEILTGDKDNTELVTDLLESMRPSAPLPEEAWWLDEYKPRIDGFRRTYNELIDALVQKVKTHYGAVTKKKLTLKSRRK